MNDRFADFGASAAAIAQQENGHVPEFAEAGAVDDRAAVPLGGHEARARQDRQMRRERVLGDLQQSGEIARSEPIRLVPDERPEGLQTSRLGQRGEGQDGFFSFHISRCMEILRARQSGIAAVERYISNIPEIWFDSLASAGASSRP